MIARETLAPKNEVTYLSSSSLSLPVAEPGLEDISENARGRVSSRIKCVLLFLVLEKYLLG